MTLRRVSRTSSSRMSLIGVGSREAERDALAIEDRMCVLGIELDHRQGHELGRRLRRRRQLTGRLLRRAPSSWVTVSGRGAGLLGAQHDR